MFSLPFRPSELLFHIQVERESDREQKTGCRVQSSYVAFVKSPVRCDFLVKIEGNKKNRYLKRVFNPYDSGEMLSKFVGYQQKIRLPFRK